jgi:RNA polymerase sigma-70 factor (ECF subfamily)
MSAQGNGPRPGPAAIAGDLSQLAARRLRRCEDALDDGVSDVLTVHDAAGSLSAGISPDADESAIIRSVQAGDRDAFERLVRLYDRGVLKLAMNLLRSPEDARDAYQEAFLRAYRNIGSFRFDCSFYTWLHRIVSNVCLDHLRRRKVRTEIPSLLETADGVVDRYDLVEEERAMGNPERSLHNRQIENRLGAALGDLTARERLIFEMRHYQGLRLRKIGEITGTSEEAARNCLFRATRKLRSALGDLI